VQKFLEKVIQMTHDQRGEAVSREQLRELLDQWRRGSINERTVHERAEGLLARYGPNPAAPSKDDPRSIAFEVVSELETLNHQLITPVDVPAFMEFLGTPSGAESAAWERWMRYWDGVDYRRRAEELADNPYYTPIPPEHYTPDWGSSSDLFWELRQLVFVSRVSAGATGGRLPVRPSPHICQVTV
jgi:hypothetical protein